MDGLLNFYGLTGDDAPFAGFHEAEEEICFTRIYSNTDGGEVQVVNSKTIHKEEVTRSIEQAAPGKKLLSCLVTICNYKEKHLPRTLCTRKSNYLYFLESMGLSKYLGFACSSILSFDVVPQYREGKSSGFCASVYAKGFLGLFYTYNKEKDLSIGIFEASSNFHPVFLEAVMSMKSLALYPGFLLLAMAASLNGFNQRHLEMLRLNVAGVEKRTGYAGWGNFEYEVTQGTFSELSAQMSGFASSLAAHRRSVKLGTEILTAIESTETLNSTNEQMATANLRHLLDSHISVIKRRITVQSMFVELQFVRVQNQISALFNLMNRTETEMSIGVAQDSRTIALASKHDSTSMKTLAAVTVVFLPGTFVASLFSMSMFDWQADAQSVLTSRFWIYWAVTIPLTLATICAWYLWISKKAAIIRSQEQRVAKHVGDDMIAPKDPEKEYEC